MSILIRQDSSLEKRSEENFGFQADFPIDRISNLKHNEEKSDDNNFVVSWQDLVYSIGKPSVDGQSVWSKCENKFKNLNACLGKLNYSTGTYDVNNKLQKCSNSKGDRKLILNHLNGSFRSSEITAILGPSGAGKTTLLSVLSRRLESNLTGQLKVDCDKRVKIKICTIPQHDQLPKQLTVRENLIYASMLKNALSDHEKNVCHVSNLLGLDDCLDTQTCRISGGQQKRLSIAQELLSKPDVLLLDEPTSGLDSSSCLKTLKVLKDIAQASANGTIPPIAIVLTIHQPQLEAFNLFDRVYFIATGGLAIYDGPPSECVGFVQKYTGLELPSVDYNPASFMIEIASGELGDEPMRKLEQHIRYDAIGKRKFLNSKTFNDTNNELELNEFEIDDRLAKGSDIDDGQFIYKTWILTKRIWHIMLQEPIVLAMRLTSYIAIPLMMAILFGTETGKYNACPSYQAEYPLNDLINTDKYINSSVEKEFSYLFENLGLVFTTINSSMHLASGLMTVYTSLDLRSSLKEYYNGWYPMSSYLISRVVANLPADIFAPLLAMTMIYILTGQNTGSSGTMPDIFRITIASAGMTLSLNVYGIMAILYSIFYLDNIASAIFASQASLMPWILLSGFCIHVKDMPKIVQYISWTSVHRHCMDIAFLARYSWNVCECNSTEFDLPGPKISNVPEKLINFVNYWQASETDTSIVDSNSTGTANKDLFELMATQVSAFNCYGQKAMKSCDQVVPFSLVFSELDKVDITHSFAALICLVIIWLIVMLILGKKLIDSRSTL